MFTVAQTFSLALEHQRAGNLRQAEEICRQILEADAGHADSIHLLGVLACQEGQHEQAASFFRKAVSLNAAIPVYHYNLGLAHAYLRRMDDAAASYSQALQLQPNFPEAHNGLGGALRGLGRLQEAEMHCRRALSLRRNYSDAHANLGLVLADRGKLAEAVAHYATALALNPNDAKVHNNLGNALFQQGKIAAAEAHYRQALRIRPQYVRAHSNLANALCSLDKAEEALTHCLEALRLDPSFAEAHHNLGCAFLEQGRVDVALPSFREALRLQPDIEAAQSNLLFCLNHFDPQADLDLIFAEHCRWGRLHQPAIAPPPHANAPNPERRLRVGYVSPDLRDHALARYLEPVLAHHNQEQVEVFCYAEVARPDAVTARLQSLVPAWRGICGLTDAQVVQQIRGDRIDILVDLAGHTRHSRLCAFAHKPAPIQVTWLGYMNTTGLTAIDYRLTDDVVDPPGQPVRDVEELVRLPGGMCCFAPPPDAPPVSSMPALQRGHLTFGSLTSLFKLNSGVYDLWSAVLQAIPSAQLLMFHHTLTASVREHICRQFMERSIGGERLDLRQGPYKPSYLAVYGEIDISLDTFPCTGGVTTCESLWMGVPVLTLRGSRPAGRNSAALVTRVGLAECIVETPDQYVALAVELANDLERLARLRAGLRDRVAGTLCDARRFTEQLEDAYRTMWRRWCAQQTSP